MAAREIDQFWDIIEKVGVAMLTTRFPGGLRAGPVEARPERNAGIICFLTDLAAARTRKSQRRRPSASSSSMPATTPDTAKAAEIRKRTYQRAFDRFYSPRTHKSGSRAVRRRYFDAVSGAPEVFSLSYLKPDLSASLVVSMISPILLSDGF
jgi:hypothetical protein